MQYTSIEDVEKVYNELFPWDKEKFIEKHANDSHININALKNKKLFEIFKELGYSDYDILDLLDEETIRHYLINIY